MGTKRAKLSEQVRRAVDRAGMSRYAICKSIGMDQSIMSRFMNGKGGLQMDSLDAVADLLKLNIVADKPRKGKAVRGGKH
jgi:predicted XRE-type DNA-binding protein